MQVVDQIHASDIKKVTHCKVNNSTDKAQTAFSFQFQGPMSYGIILSHLPPVDKSMLKYVIIQLI